MSYRILNCSNSLENYYLCINEKVVGFANRTGQPNDIIYITVKIDKTILCGARAILSEITDYKPWEDSDRYKQCFSLKNIEFCQPFSINILSNIDKSNWYIKFVQTSKTIKSTQAIELLNSSFYSNKLNKLYLFPLSQNVNDINEENTFINKSILNKSSKEKEFVDNHIKIMGTFQTINFLNETDNHRGLQSLVNKNFYNLFTFFPENRTLLIPDSRKFITKGFEGDITGIRGIPDGLLIVYNKDLKNPVQINLIEYECYGEQKTKSIDKFNYLNGHIIPQLMRFASTFSIVTDQQIREQTIVNWTAKIIDYIFSNHSIQSKVTS